MLLTRAWCNHLARPAKKSIEISFLFFLITLALFVTPLICQSIITK